MSAAVFPRDYKRDDRPQRGMWAPGRYLNKCCICGARFIGDKRALHCADCEYETPQATQEITPP